LKIRVHALNGVPDHVHLACTLPVTLSIAAAMQQLKGSSSHFVNHLASTDQRFEWQEGYGALTFSKRDLPRIVAYIDRQKEHHAQGTLSEKMERFTDED
jgi:putative transposase